MFFSSTIYSSGKLVCSNKLPNKIVNLRKTLLFNRSQNIILMKWAITLGQVSQFHKIENKLREPWSRKLRLAKNTINVKQYYQEIKLQHSIISSQNLNDFLNSITSWARAKDGARVRYVMLGARSASAEHWFNLQPEPGVVCATLLSTNHDRPGCQVETVVLRSIHVDIAWAMDGEGDIIVSLFFIIFIFMIYFFNDLLFWQVCQFIQSLLFDIHTRKNTIL